MDRRTNGQKNKWTEWLLEVKGDRILSWPPSITISNPNIENRVMLKNKTDGETQKRQKDKRTDNN